MPPGRLPTLRRGASHITFAWRGRLGFQLGATTRTLTQPACVSRLLAGLASTASVKIDLVNVGNHISSKHACRRTALCAPVQLTLSLKEELVVNVPMFRKCRPRAVLEIVKLCPVACRVALVGAESGSQTRTGSQQDVDLFQQSGSR